jgi:hypothetical protein
MRILWENVEVLWEDESSLTHTMMSWVPEIEFMKKN